MKKECLGRIRDIYCAIRAFEHQLEKAFGLNINEVMLLCLVAEKDDISSGEIAEHMGLTCSNASKVIASLEKSGLIVRRTCKNDKRCMKFSITPAGITLISKVGCESVQLPESLKCLSEKS